MIPAMCGAAKLLPVLTLVALVQPSHFDINPGRAELDR